MTSRERMLCAIRGEAPDRVPVSPWGFGHVDPESAVGQELIAKCDLWVEGWGAGFSFSGARLATETATETTPNGTITTTTYHTPAGDLRSRHQRTAVTSATIEFPCKNAADVEKLLSVPYEPHVPDFSGFHKTKARFGDEALACMGVCDAVCWPATVLSPEDFCLLWADAPDVMAEMCRVASERLDAFVEAACRAGVDGFRIIGGEYVTVQLGPRAVPELLAPFDTRQIGIMHRHGAFAHYHNHGPMMHPLSLPGRGRLGAPEAGEGGREADPPPRPSLEGRGMGEPLTLDALADLGIDSMDPFEAPPCGDCDLAEAKRRLRGRTCIVGNLDDMEVLEQRSEAEVCDIAAARLEQAGPDGFMLGGTSSGTYAERAARNFIAMVRVAEAYARRP